MTHSGSSHTATKAKTRTGVAGLDEITNGGLPSGRVTLLLGGAGTGKTVLALQTLVNGARDFNEAGIFVAFEENSRQIIANARTFGWDVPDLERKSLFFLDAQPRPQMVQSGNFDLGGMLSALKAKARDMRARRIVFDSVDVVLELLADPAAQRREVHRLHHWLLESGLTGLVTAKEYGRPTPPPGWHSLGYMQFMVDCAVELKHQWVDGVSQRNLRVLKYRGSAFYENESPLLISSHGLEVAGGRRPAVDVAKATTARVSSGISRLDAMLDGGYYRGASVLITGSPGTAKSTLCGCFAAAAGRRRERTLFVSFDSATAELVRNLASVNIQLQPFIAKGLLTVVAARTGDGSAEEQFMRIKLLADEHAIRNLIIDPVSTLAKQGNELTAHSVMERLTDWVKSRGITLVSTSLLDNNLPQQEGTPLQISTIADTWMHLSYLVHAGERNRALTIIKSRGTAHSKQVRELVLTDKGVTLADVYSAGGEVLMGTLRWEKEQELSANQRRLEAESHSRKIELDLAEAQLLARFAALKLELASNRAAQAALGDSEKKRQRRLSKQLSGIRGLRGADVQISKT